MNRVILMGRLTRDPEVRYSQGERSMAIARYTLAVDRRGRARSNQDGDQGQTADFINIVAFDRAGEFPPGNESSGIRKNSDRQLHQQRRSARLYHRGDCG